MLMLFTVIALSVGSAKLPTKMVEAAGYYSFATGFEVSDYRLRENGKLEISNRFDHPGGKSWVGFWRFQEGVIQMFTPYKSNEKWRVSEVQAVPIAWGDRLMLVDPEELVNGTIRRLFIRIVNQNARGAKLGESPWDIPVPIKRQDATLKMLPTMERRPHPNLSIRASKVSASVRDLFLTPERHVTSFGVELIAVRLNVN
ncbi:MAG: hypothetical protein ABL949_07265 [Fimbriimonadaceae bacterium]